MIKNPVPWPDGKKGAVAFTFDMATDSLIHLEHPEDGFRRVSGISMPKYGPEVAVPRIVDTYRHFDIQQTFFVPAWCIENYPAAVKAMVDGGCEDYFPKQVEGF
jgi:peptidoglycan-N-acetylglucosamine deacetylase